MKILLVHSQLTITGGDSIYTIRLMELLRKNGHDVELWGMKNENNIPHSYAQYDVDEIDFKTIVTQKNISNAITVIKRSIYSYEAKEKINFVLQQFKPDIVHLQSIHYSLTTSIIDVIREYGIPIVWTQHNFAMICCNSLYANNTICEACKPNKFYSPILVKCKKDSLSASLIGSFQLYFDYYRKTYEKVNRIIVLTSFYKGKLADFGIKKELMEIIPNFYDAHTISEHDKKDTIGDYILYYGNLNSWKGVKVVIDAIKKIDKSLKLYIVGDGPQRKELEQCAQGDHRIHFFDHQTQEQLQKTISKARFVIVPSILYENFPNVVLESYGHKKPVIGSDIGGISIMIIDGVTGFLFEPSNVDELASKIETLYDNEELTLQMGNAARNHLDRYYSADLHYQKLMKVYQNVLIENATR